MVSRKSSPVQKFTDADMADALKEAFTQLDDRSKGLSRKRYKELMAGKDVPAAATFIRRYGTWSEACKRAGVTAAKARRDNYVQDWSNDDIVAAVADFIATSGRTSYHAYAELGAREPSPERTVARAAVGRLGGCPQAGHPA